MANNRKPIAVITNSHRAYNAFIDVVMPMNRKDFVCVHVDNPDTCRGYEFSQVICLRGEYDPEDKTGALYDYTQTRVR